MNEKYQEEECLDKLQSKLHIIGRIHKSNNLLQSQHSDQFEHGEELNLIANIREEVTQHFVKGDGCQEVDQEIALHIISLYIFNVLNFLSCLQVLVGGSEIQDDVNKIKKIDKQVESVDEEEFDEAFVAFEE